MPTRTIRGVAASPGIAIGHITRYEALKLTVSQQTATDSQHELQRLEQALAQAKQEIQQVYAQARLTVSAHEAAIFEAHESFLEDPELQTQVQAMIQQQAYSAAYAWQVGIEQYSKQLRELNDDYLAARSADLEDVGQRVLRILQGKQEQTLHLQEPTIIVASDLTPSETVQFDPELVCAFCIAGGGPTSHVAILARALGIPAITGLGREIEHLRAGQLAIIDGNRGEILLEPEQTLLETYRLQALSQVEQQQKDVEAAQKPAFTLDGKQIEIVANIGNPAQVKEAIAYGAEGIGLLRTEFLFLERTSAPSEEEQFSIYHDILKAMHPYPVVVRTFDIGGDKPAPYMAVDAEMNPFLGKRGIRLALAQPEFLHTQLRALLRAAMGQQLRIMFPMVSSYEEIEELHRHIRLAQESLETEQRSPTAEVQIGIMIEVPAAALMAEELAELVDFFSIGTNDLTQYTLAADRTNEATANFADALHPAVLRLIQLVCQAAHKHKRWVGLCGELAADPLALPVLLGLELDELSMTPKAIPLCKQHIRRYSLEETHEIAQQALQKRNAAEVRAYLSEIVQSKGSD